MAGGYMSLVLRAQVRAGEINSGVNKCVDDIWGK